jgi:hypothetical protein
MELAALEDGVFTGGGVWRSLSLIHAIPPEGRLVGRS